MQYWRGYMNWPLDKGWACGTCGGNILIWGLVHGCCRCDVCHTEYDMRDSNDEHVTRPISRLKSEYKEPAKTAWKQWRVPVDELTAEQWAEAGV